MSAVLQALLSAAAMAADTLTRDPAALMARGAACSVRADRLRTRAVELANAGRDKRAAATLARAHRLERRAEALRARAAGTH